MSRLPLLTPGALDAEQRALYDAILAGPRGSPTRDDGALIGPFNAWLYSPSVGAAINRLGETIRFSSSLEPRLLELAILMIGREWSAQFEWWAHARYGERAGLAPETIEAVRARRAPDSPRSDEALVYRFCRELIDTRRVRDDVYAEARSLLGESGLVELVTLLGYYSLVSMMLNVFEVPLPEGATPPFPEPPEP